MVLSLLHGRSRASAHEYSRYYPSPQLAHFLIYLPLFEPDALAEFLSLVEGSVAYREDYFVGQIKRLYTSIDTGAAGEYADLLAEDVTRDYLLEASIESPNQDKENPENEIKMERMSRAYTSKLQELCQCITCPKRADQMCYATLRKKVHKK